MKPGDEKPGDAVCAAPDPLCARVWEFAPQVVEGGLPADEAGALRTHASACGSCASVLARQTRLSSILRSLPAAPSVELVAPSLPRGRVLRVAGAAAAAAAAVVISVTLLMVEDRDLEAAFVPVRVLHVQDLAERAPLPDDDILSLTSGLEAVALRRPVGFASEGR